jgi:Lon protease-like protein
MAGSYLRTTDLPQVIPVFPLDGVLLLPQGMLPLNIFEPRYLNMIDDVMAGDRIIGMIQTAASAEGAAGERSRPSLAQVGCAGRITSYAETPDGRYLITLTGVCRFRIGPELSTQTPYRQVRADFSAYGQDLAEVEPAEAEERPALISALRTYLERRGLAVDWKMADEAPLEALVNSLAMALPFDAAEKQALLEAETLTDRRLALTALLRIDGAMDDDTPTPVQ